LSLPTPAGEGADAFELVAFTRRVAWHPAARRRAVAGVLGLLRSMIEGCNQSKVIVLYPWEEMTSTPWS